MKELSIEQKAKRYDEAIERARKVLLDCTTEERKVVEYISPELAESKDEMIRKEILKAFSRGHDNSDIYGHGITYGDVRAWLEKQAKNSVCKVKIGETYKCIASPRYTCFRMGDNYHVKDNFVAELINMCSGCFVLLEKQGEQILANSAKTCKDGQESADKVEPKFHEGEWLCENEPNNYARFIQILETVNVQGKEKYRISRDIHNDEDIVEFNFVEKYYHKFDIKDAKHSDVLATENFIFIFKNIDNDNCVHYYCHYEISKHEDDNQFGVALPQSYMGRIGDSISHYFPATKEQRDTIEKAMADAGYTFDFDKKELKKIEQKPAENKGMDLVEEDMTPFQKYVFGIIDLGIEQDRGLKQVCDELLALASGEIKKSAWSEEDEKTLNEIFSVAARASLRKNTLFGKSYDYIKWLIMAYLKLEFHLK